MILRQTIILAVLALVLAACGDGQIQEANKSEDRSSEKPRIALIMKSLANEFFVSMAAGARDHNEQNTDAYELIVNGIKTESDLAQQVALVDQMISAQVDAIVIAPADSKALVPALSRADQASIIVINIDNRLEPSILKDYGLNIPFIGPSNREGAEMIGRFALQNLEAGTEIAVLEGIPSAFNSIERREGFKQAARKEKMDVVTVQSGDWDQTKAAQVTAGILSQFPNLGAILAANDNMAIGAASAIGMAGQTGKITVAGFDNIDAIHQLILDNRVIGTVDQFGDQLAVFGIEYAIEALTTGQSQQDKQTPLELITKETLENG
ncbi:MAG: hypothetical protein CBE21_03820 [Proteobacteria bacterium TMED261]|nr:MAG: hypothetical protein CBE21_03820 [Proteobacteria bacterium TMED261]